MADLSKELSKELNKDFAYCEDALGRAENAIGNLPSVQPEKRTEKRTETHSCDLIDRQAAVDAIYHHLPSVSRMEARLMLHEVPSAQPEIIRCKDCKNWDTTWTNDFSPNYHYCSMVDGVRKDDWYCADAERRTDEE